MGAASFVNASDSRPSWFWRQMNSIICCGKNSGNIELTYRLRPGLCGDWQEQHPNVENEMEANRGGCRPRIMCALCGETVAGLDAFTESGWSSSYKDSEGREKGPICEDCIHTCCWLDHANGELRFAGDRATLE